MATCLACHKKWNGYQRFRISLWRFFCKGCAEAIRELRLELEGANGK